MSHFRTSSATLPMTTGRAPKKRKLLSCFNIVLALVFLQVFTLLALGFFSNNLSFEVNWQSPLNYLDFFQVNELNDDLREMEDLEAEKAEAGLVAGQEGVVVDGERGETQEEEGIARAIDNYYSRTHITRDSIGMKVPLVVGGSDGSGTRAFVDILGHLGVPMLVDDSGTMDVHGKALFGGRGWPPLATAILQETRSSNYNFEDLPKNLQDLTLREIKKLHQGFINRGETLLERVRVQNISGTSNLITYGFKAPVTMLLVPVLQQVMGPLKFLHIVRDGRDVAMSQNQSPVKKFFNDSYSDAQLRIKKYTGDFTPVLGMQLWNDWNTGLLEYEQKHADGKSFDFLVMRTEDLLNPEKKFKSLIQLADFVGSQKTMKELCCMSRKAVVDMGVSGSAGSGSRLKDLLMARGKMDSLFRKRFEDETLALREKIDGLRQGMHASRNASSLIDMESETQKEKLEVIEEIMAKKREGKIRNQSDANERQEKIVNIGNRIAERLSARRKAMYTSVVTNNENVLNTSKSNSMLHGGTQVSTETKETFWHRRLQLGLHLEKRPQHEVREMIRGRILDSKKQEQFTQLLTEIHKAKEVGDSKRVELLASQLHKMRAPEPEIKEIAKLGVTKRYGKWVELLKEKPALSLKLHNEGAKGLSAFGYEPAKRFQDPGEESDYLCDDTIRCW